MCGIPFLKNRWLSCVRPCLRFSGGSFTIVRRDFPHVSHDFLATQDGVADIAIYMRKARLMYLPRLIKHAPKMLRALLQATSYHDDSWASAVRQDIAWLRCRSEKLQGLPMPVIGSMQQWHDFIECRPKYWAAIIKRVVSKVEFNEIPGDPISLKANGENQMFCPCSVCERVFPSLAARHMHMFKEHGWRAPSRCYANGSGNCSKCLKSFHNRSRLQRHLQSSLKTGGQRSCLAQMIISGMTPLSEEEVLELERDDRLSIANLKAQGKSHSFASKPCIQHRGPRDEVKLGPLPEWVMGQI
jgi:hypothetical protein